MINKSYIQYKALFYALFNQDVGEVKNDNFILNVRIVDLKLPQKKLKVIVEIHEVFPQPELESQLEDFEIKASAFTIDSIVNINVTFSRLEEMVGSN